MATDLHVYHYRLPVEAEKAERMCARHDERVAAKLPLLAWAGLLEKKDAARFKERWDAGAVEWNQHLHETVARSEIYRAQVARWVTAAELAQLDEHRWRVYPKTPEYSADFWHSQWFKTVARRIAEGPCYQQEA